MKKVDRLAQRMYKDIAGSRPGLQRYCLIESTREVSFCVCPQSQQPSDEDSKRREAEAAGLCDNVY